jgi:hypothetical protein
MKPRLESAPMTDDDVNIGVWLMARWLVRFGEARLNCELAQDERDADLMLQCQRWRAMGLTAAMQVPGWINEGPGWQPVGGDITPAQWAMRCTELMTEERQFLNRTWCPTCLSHFCSCRGK